MDVIALLRIAYATKFASWDIYSSTVNTWTGNTKLEEHDYQKRLADFLKIKFINFHCKQARNKLRNRYSFVSMLSRLRSFLVLRYNDIQLRDFCHLILF